MGAVCPCLPQTPAKGEHQFTYFKMYKARGEPPRIALHASGVSWKDTSIDDFAKYTKDKAAGKYSTGVPVLRTPSGKEYTQSIAIARYAARLGNAGLYPDDPEIAMSIDEVMDVCNDAFSLVPQDADKEALKTKREQFAAGKLKALMGILAKRLEVSRGPYFAGEKLSIADIVAKYFLTDPIKNGELVHIPKDYVEQWPALVKMDSAVESHPIVKAYQASKSP